MVSGHPPPPQPNRPLPPDTNRVTRRRKPDLSIGIPEQYLVWIASNPRALLADVLMLLGIVIFVVLAFSIDAKVGIGALATAFILVSVLITTTGGVDDGNA